jgi:hypothetical protein
MEDPDPQRPKNPLEAASYDLKKFRERRLADRRFMRRGTPDRRVAVASPENQAPPEPKA